MGNTSSNSIDVQPISLLNHFKNSVNSDNIPKIYPEESCLGPLN